MDGVNGRLTAICILAILVNRLNRTAQFGLSQIVFYSTENPPNLIDGRADDTRIRASPAKSTEKKSNYATSLLVKLAVSVRWLSFRMKLIPFPFPVHLISKKRVTSNLFLWLHRGVPLEPFLLA